MSASLLIGEKQTNKKTNKQTKQNKTKTNQTKKQYHHMWCDQVKSARNQIIDFEIQPHKGNNTLFFPIAHISESEYLISIELSAKCCLAKWWHHGGFPPPPILASPSPVCPKNNLKCVKKLATIWQFQHKNGKFLYASHTFFTFLPP